MKVEDWIDIIALFVQIFAGLFIAVDLILKIFV